jgi:hypothetical protein
MPLANLNIHIKAQVYGDWLKDHAERQLYQVQPDLKQPMPVCPQ